MTLLHRLRSLLRWTLRRPAIEQDLDAELQTFLDLAAAEKIREGIPLAEARRLARIELGGIDQVKEQVRSKRHGALVDEITGNFRYAVRMFHRQPVFFAIVVVVLALGIGANIAIFSLIDALTLRWLPVNHPEELLQVQMGRPDVANQYNDNFSYPIARAIARQTDIFSSAAGFSGMSFNVRSHESVNKVAGAVVTGRFYETLGLHPVIGRLITASDDEPGAPLVAVISYGYWEREFARASDAVEQSISLNGVRVPIIGVSPPGFVGANVGAIADITIPLAALPQVNPPSVPLLGPGNFWLRVLARPQPGISPPQASARLTGAWQDISAQLIPPGFPTEMRKRMEQASFNVVPGGTGWTYLRQIYSKPLLILMSMVAVVLLIACANVASLLLARASTRRREMALRIAIGAGARRIFVQLLTESLLLSSIAAIAGLGLAWAAGRILMNIISTGPGSITFDLTPNWHVLSFAAAIALLTSVLFGLAPALQLASAEPATALKNDTRSTVRSRLLSSLVSVQIALSLVLLIAAVLFARTLHNLQDVDAGFKHDGVLLVSLNSQRTAVPVEMVEELERLPNVMSASVSTNTPLSGATWTEPTALDGEQLPERDNAILVGTGPRYFETLRIPVLAGREFTSRDVAGAPHVAIVDETFAQRRFPGKNAVGQHLLTKVRGEIRNLEIVGVVKNTKTEGLRRTPYPTVYVAYAQLPGNFPTTIEIHAAGSLSQSAAAIRDALQPKLPGSPIEVVPFAAQVDASIVQERMMATLASAFGLLALTLVCVGVYGLIAYQVAARTKEMCIRIALGAQRQRVIVMVLASATKLVLIGVAAGLPAVWVLSRWIESLLFGLKPTDSPTILAAVLSLIVIALLAAYLPARRASLADPIVALRQD